jgi:hypothetical protein
MNSNAQDSIAENFSCHDLVLRCHHFCSLVPDGCTRGRVAGSPRSGENRSSDTIRRSLRREIERIAKLDQHIERHHEAEGVAPSPRHRSGSRCFFVRRSDIHSAELTSRFRHWRRYVSNLSSTLSSKPKDGAVRNAPASAYLETYPRLPGGWHSACQILLKRKDKKGERIELETSL